MKTFDLVLGIVERLGALAFYIIAIVRYSNGEVDRAIVSVLLGLFLLLWGYTARTARK